MYVFQESPQRHKVPVILGRQSIVTPKTARLRSDQNTHGNTYSPDASSLLVQARI